MAKAELGTKRTCPETDKKFYDLGKDPVVSPYTGKSYPLSFFDLPTGPTRNKPAPPIKAVKPEETVEDEDDLEIEGAEVVSLDDADEEVSADDDKNLPDLGDNTDDDIEDIDVAGDDDSDEDDTFLAVDDDEDDDVADIIPIAGEDEDDS